VCVCVLCARVMSVAEYDRELACQEVVLYVGNLRVCVVMCEYVCG